MNMNNDETNIESLQNLNDESHDVSADESNLDDVSTDSIDNNSNDESNKKKGSGFEKRIKKLNKKIAEANSEAEYWKNKALVSKETEGALKPAAATSQSINTSKPKFSDYSDIETYTDALTEWKIEQTLSAKEQKKVQQTTLSQHNERVNVYKATVDDFDKVLAKTETWNSPSSEMTNAIIEADNGPELLYYLGKNKEEYDRILSLSPTKQIIELGKLTAKFERQARKAEKEQLTQAPKPLANVKNTSKKIEISLNNDGLSDVEWRKAREDALREKRLSKR